MATISFSRELSSQEAAIVVEIIEFFGIYYQQRKIGSYSLTKDRIFWLRN